MTAWAELEAAEQRITEAERLATEGDVPAAIVLALDAVAAALLALIGAMDERVETLEHRTGDHTRKS